MTTYLWLGAMIVFLMIEASTVVLVSSWFAVGALAALIASLLSAPFWLQIVIFFVVSAVLLACLRPLVRKYIKPKIVRTNVDSLIGSKGYITDDIDNIAAVGQVKLGGMEWSARSTSGEPIPKGTLVKVDKIEGVRVFVTPVTEDASVGV